MKQSSAFFFFLIFLWSFKKWSIYFCIKLKKTELLFSILLLTLLHQTVFQSLCALNLGDPFREALRPLACWGSGWTQPVFQTAGGSAMRGSPRTGGSPSFSRNRPNSRSLAVCFNCQIPGERIPYVCSSWLQAALSTAYACDAS